MKALWTLLLGTVSVGAQSLNDEAVKHDTYSVLKRTVIPLVDLEKAHPEEALDYVRRLAISHDPHAKDREKAKSRRKRRNPGPDLEKDVDEELDVEVEPYDGPWITLTMRNAPAINVIVEIAKQIDAVPYREADGTITLFRKGEKAGKGYTRIWPAITPKTNSANKAVER